MPIFALPRFAVYIRETFGFPDIRTPPIFDGPLLMPIFALPRFAVHIRETFGFPDIRTPPIFDGPLLMPIFALPRFAVHAQELRSFAHGLRPSSLRSVRSRASLFRSRASPYVHSRLYKNMQAYFCTATRSRTAHCFMNII